MRQLRLFTRLALLIFAGSTLRRDPNNTAAASVPQAQRPQAVTHVVDLKTSDGKIL